VATADAQKALAGGADNFLTYERRETVSHGATDVRTYLRVGRPRGQIGIDMLLRRPNAKALGSNIHQLVGHRQVELVGLNAVSDGYEGCRSEPLAQLARQTWAR
jgi:hypothetical protein